MFKKLMLVLLLLSLSLIPASAQEEEEPKSDKLPEREKHLKHDRATIFLEKLKKEHPEKARELEDLRESNPEEFRRQVKDLTHRKMKRGQRDGHTKAKHWLKEMKSKDPEKFNQLMELRDRDPETFRKEIVQEYGKRFSSGRQYLDGKSKKEIGRLLQQYTKAVSDEEKTSLKDQLREKLTDSFEKDLQRRNKRVDHLEKQLNNIKQQIEARQAAKESLIEKQVESLIQRRLSKLKESELDKKVD